MVREVAVAIQQRLERQSSADVRERHFTMIEKMFALGAAPMFSQLTLEELAELAQASSDAEYGPGEMLFEEGKPGNEVCILLSGEVVFLQGQGPHERVIGKERAGSLIGEMAVLDPAPRSATVRAGADGMHVLRLDGEAFREVLNANPAIASGIIRTLAQRLRSVVRTDQAVNVT
jgi:CRP-like cAMP-binding protein